MSERQPTGMSDTSRVIAALGELIDALDSRVPHVERVGEIQIAREAAMLRSEAVKRINELRRAGSDPHIPDADLVNAIMTDDGGPARKE